MYHSTDLLTVRGVAHLVAHGTSGSTSYETIPHVQLAISGDVLSTADMVVQRRDGPRRLREIDDDDIWTAYDSHAHTCSRSIFSTSFARGRGDAASGAPSTETDKLQRVLNAAAHVITGTREFDRGLGQILHDQLHWLDVPDRVLFKLAVTVHQCLNGRAPPYLSEHCIPVSSADTRRHLRSANRHLLAVPRFRLITYGRRAFSVAGPMAWNSLLDFIRDPTSNTDCFRRLLKTYLFALY